MDLQVIGDLMISLTEMQSAYGDALRSGTTRRDGDIPPHFWGKPIRALNPIRIYYDVSNIAIVQGISNGFEYGKYISPSTSSHMPQGDIVLTHTCGPVSDYRKRITPDVFWDQNEHYFKPTLR
jgi:hypothetical protein